DYIGYIEHRLKYKVILPNLRDKSEGWLASGHQESFLLANMEKCKYTFYANLFYQHFLRPACGNCKYANLDRCGDITVGDCWGIEKEYPSFNDGDAGVNLVLVNSLGGQRLFDSVSKSLDVMNIQNENWWIQPNLLRPSTLSPNYDAFWDEYRKYGFRYVLRKYVFVKQKQEKIKLFIWNALKVVRLEKLFQRLYHGFLR
ncbi:MAG: Coenzyme F420 hydrogenase/dehydrogenase, beta subunit C-terminal domain, partial [Fibrobacteraceae bacterium]|nr:Coenzyme F420 hydrogenase/dehydrogenase, beta subunit C-terminal domain [Fibrobacteraceae bacterium]